MSQSIKEIAAAYDQWSLTYEINENATRDPAAHVLRHQHGYINFYAPLQSYC